MVHVLLLAVLNFETLPMGRASRAEWTIEVWRAPTVLPPVIDYPEDYLPEALPPADLILSFAEILM